MLAPSGRSCGEGQACCLRSLRLGRRFVVRQSSAQQPQHWESGGRPSWPTVPVVPLSYLATSCQ